MTSIQAKTIATSRHEELSLNKEHARAAQQAAIKLGTQTFSFRTPVLTGVVFLVSLLFFVLPLGIRPFATKGEGREATVVQAMLAQDNFILPLRNGVDIPSKPPMFHWIAAGASTALGEVSEFAVRLPSALTAALALAIFFAFVLSVSSLKRATLATLILATSFEWSRSGSHARVDMCFTLGLMVALMLVYRLLAQEQGSRVFSILLVFGAALSAAFAVLSKGPTALVFICAIGALYALCQLPNLRFASLRTIPIGKLLLALGVTVLLSGAWYVFAYQQHGQAFLDVQLLRENFARVVEMPGQGVGHEKPFYYSFQHLLLGFLPWSLLFPVSGLWIWKGRRKIFQQKGFMLFALLWAAVFFLAVTASVSKRVVYLLPAFPAIAYLVAASLENALARGKKFASSFQFMVNLSAILLGILSLGFFVGVVGLVTMEFPTLLEGIKGIVGERTAQDLTLAQAIVYEHHALIGFAFAAFLLTTAATFYCFKSRGPALIASLASSILVLTLAINFFVLPAVALQGSPKNFLSKVEQIVPETTPLFQFSETLYSVIFYAGRNVPVLDRSELLLVEPGSFVLVWQSHLSVLQADLSASKLQAKLVLESQHKAAEGKDRLVLIEMIKR